MNRTAYLITAIAYPLVYLLFKLFFALRIKGRENIPKTGGVLILANHTSFLDPPLIGCTSPRHIKFMARSTLFEVPLFGRLITILGAFPIKRGQADRGALKKTLKLLEEGEVVLVFPEGTRSQNGRLQEGRPGAGMLAFSAAEKGANIIPAKVIGSFKAYPKGASFPRPTKIEVIYGEPIKFNLQRGDQTPKEIYKEAVNMIMEKIKKL